MKLKNLVGVKTRNNVKLTEAVLAEYSEQQRQRNQTSYDAQEMLILMIY